MDGSSRHLTTGWVLEGTANRGKVGSISPALAARFSALDYVPTESSETLLFNALGQLQKMQ